MTILRRIWAALRRQKPKTSAPPRAPMHWTPGPDGMPLCGASRRERWTIEWEAATCAVCRSRGLSLIIQHGVNTR